MSVEIDDGILDAMADGEWRSSAQVADLVPRGTRSLTDHRALVRHHLRKLVRYGHLEERRADDPSRGWRYEWRRIQ